MSGPEDRILAARAGSETEVAALAAQVERSIAALESERAVLEARLRDVAALLRQLRLAGAAASPRQRQRWQRPAETPTPATPVEDSGLPFRIVDAMATAAGYDAAPPAEFTLGVAAERLTAAQLLKVRGFGAGSLHFLEDVLALAGLELSRGEATDATKAVST